jgi:hypothetical protein
VVLRGPCHADCLSWLVAGHREAAGISRRNGVGHRVSAHLTSRNLIIESNIHSERCTVSCSAERPSIASALGVVVVNTVRVGVVGTSHP